MFYFVSMLLTQTDIQSIHKLSSIQTRTNNAMVRHGFIKMLLKIKTVFSFKIWALTRIQELFVPPLESEKMDDEVSMRKNGY